MKENYLKTNAMCQLIYLSQFIYYAALNLLIQAEIKNLSFETRYEKINQLDNGEQRYVECR